MAKNGKFVDEVKLSVSGDHNIMNALAACVVADRLEVPFPLIKKTLKTFRGQTTVTVYWFYKWYGHL